MRRVKRALFGLNARDERGSEFAAAIIVFPVMFVLIIGSIEVGFYSRTRMLTENIARDAARQVAADGGNLNTRTNTTGLQIDTVARRNLVTASHCKLSQCTSLPTISCTKVTRANGTSYTSNTVDYAGETVTCTVAYRYKPLAAELMDGPLGLGIGTMLKPFTVNETARAETGTKG